MKIADFDFDSYDYPGPGHIGSAHSVSGDVAEDDVVSRLRDVVEEITGCPVKRESRRIGFLD